MSESCSGWAVGLDDFTLLQIIGKGSYAKVLLARRTKTGMICALKVIKKARFSNQRQHVFAERQILATCRHPFIISMFSSFRTAERLYFVLEYCPGGELFSLLQRKNRFSEEMTKFYAAQILLALDYLHQRDIAYLDLKPQNVLLDRDGYIRLTDFGLSVRNIATKEKFQIVGTPQYLAPEVLSNCEVGLEADWWCFGTIIYEMIVGVPPFYDEEQSRQHLFQRIKSEPPKWMFSISPVLKDLLSRLLDKNKSTRLGCKGAESVRNHPWFENVRWNKLLNKEHRAPFVPVIRNEEEAQCHILEYIENEVVSPDQQRSVDSGKTYKGFSYEISPNSKGKTSLSPPEASPPELQPQEFQMRTKEGHQF